MKIHLDYETFSLADLKSVGAFRYAQDESTEILCAAMAIDDEEPEVFSRDVDVGWCISPKYKSALLDPAVLTVCHNAQFEMAVSLALMEKTWGIPCPALSRFRCTMSLARRAALPSKLEKLAEVLMLTHQKDKRGASLIRKFSMMQKGHRVSKKRPQGSGPYRIRPEDDPAAFAEFMDYCRIDVKVEQEVARKLAYFDDDLNNANYSLDAVINARGVPVNLTALNHAQTLVNEETALVSERFRKLTGFEVTQNAKLLAWINDGPLFKFDNLQAETLDTFLEGYENHSIVPREVEALRMKQSIAYASIKKIATMLACAGPHDNRIRGMLNHHGATTGRWTASLVQFQNMKRATVKESEAAYKDICGGTSREMLELTYGPVMETLANTVRHYLHDACPQCHGTGDGDMEVEGILSCRACGGTMESPLLDCDYASVESRIVCWLAGQEDALEEYRQGIDRYKRMASFIYKVPVDEVNKHPQRFVGKQCILGCGFQMGPPKFRMTCKKMGNYDLPLGLEEIAVKAFRAKHPKLVQYWYEMDRTAKKAILNKNTIFRAGAHLSFLHKDVEGMPFLLMKLPSGRKLAYPKPRVMPSRKFEDATTIVFFGHILGAQWGDVDTYGGKLLENATQAVAADIMANGAHNAEREGYAIATLIHDQCLTYKREGQTAERLVELLTQLPDWAAGLPLAAEGSEVPFYRKD